MFGETVEFPEVLEVARLEPEFICGEFIPVLLEGGLKTFEGFSASVDGLGVDDGAGGTDGSEGDGVLGLELGSGAAGAGGMGAAGDIDDGNGSGGTTDGLS